MCSNAVSSIKSGLDRSVLKTVCSCFADVIDSTVLLIAASTPTNNSTSTLLHDYCHGCKLTRVVIALLFSLVIFITVLTKCAISLKLWFHSILHVVSRIATSAIICSDRDFCYRSSSLVHLFVCRSVGLSVRLSVCWLLVAKRVLCNNCWSYRDAVMGNESEMSLFYCAHWLVSHFNAFSS